MIEFQQFRTTYNILLILEDIDNYLKNPIHRLGIQRRSIEFITDNTHDSIQYVCIY